MIGSAFGSLGPPDEPHRVAGAPRRVGILGDLDHLPSLRDEAPQPLEFGIVAPSSHPCFLSRWSRVVGSLQAGAARRVEPGTGWVRSQSVRTTTTANLDFLPEHTGRRRPARGPSE